MKKITFFLLLILSSCSSLKKEEHEDNMQLYSKVEFTSLTTSTEQEMISVNFNNISSFCNLVYGYKTFKYSDEVLDRNLDKFLNVAKFIYTVKKNFDENQYLIPVYVDYLNLECGDLSRIFNDY